MPKAVIFDWDGTLADTRNVVVASFQKAVCDLGVSVKAEFIERQIGTGAEQTFKEILQAADKTYDEGTIRKLLKKKIEDEISMSDEVKLFPGARELLESLRGKTRVALASMNNFQVIEYLLNATKIQSLFDVVLSVEDVRKFKPDPEIFLKCADRLRCKPEECIVVEDSIFGVQAARAANMICIAVLTGVYNRKELSAAKPRLIVQSLKEKKKILQLIFE